MIHQLKLALLRCPAVCGQHESLSTVQSFVCHRRDDFNVRQLYTKRRYDVKLLVAASQDNTLLCSRKLPLTFLPDVFPQARHAGRSVQRHAILIDFYSRVGRFVNLLNGVLSARRFILATMRPGLPAGRVISLAMT